MILLDTNVLSELMRVKPDEKVITHVNKFSDKTSFISAITHAEILQGIALLDDGMRKQQLERTAIQVLSIFTERTLAFDQFTSPFYVDAIRQRTRIGRPIDFPDAQIAAIALQYGLQLYTRNTRDFENIEGLEVINPWL